MKPKETDIAGALMAWLVEMGWDCYPEVKANFTDRRPDIVAIQGPVLWVIETKVSASLDLLAQGRKWIGYANRVSVASYHYPSEVAREYCKWHGIGVLYVPLCGRDIREYGKARTLPKARTKGLRKALHPDQKQYMPGNACGDFSSPWKRTMREAKYFIKHNPGTPLKPLIQSIKHHYQTAPIAMSALRQWLDRDPEIHTTREGRKIRYWAAQ